MIPAESSPTVKDAPLKWWVIRENSGIPKDPHIMAYATTQANSPRSAAAYANQRPGASVAAGPYNTQREANNWIDKKIGVPPGTTPTLPVQTMHAKGLKFPKLPSVHIPNPLSGLDEIGAVLDATYNAVTDIRMWRSVSWITLGLVLLIIGIRMWVANAGISMSMPSLPSILPSAAALAV